MNYPKIKQFWQRIMRPHEGPKVEEAPHLQPQLEPPANENFWPPEKAFLDISRVHYLADSRVRCVGVAVCDETGAPTLAFEQGQWVHFFYEFEVLEEIGLPGPTIELVDPRYQIVYGKELVQIDPSEPEKAQPGTRLCYHHAIQLNLKPDRYSFTICLFSAAESDYQCYRQGQIDYPQFQKTLSHLYRAPLLGSFEVTLSEKVSQQGSTPLPDHCQLTIKRPSSTRPTPAIARQKPVMNSTIFHVTHYKAGSQWLYKILLKCASEYIIQPQVDLSQFLRWPLQPGKLYPTVYVTKEQFESVPLPAHWHRFVVIRDLRDTLISDYFSQKKSHPLSSSSIYKIRNHLNNLELEDGLLHLIDNRLPSSSRIQLSWVEAGEPFIRYEDLLQDDVGILERVLLDQCELPVSREKFRQAVLANRFESLTKGRQRGEEDTSAHERKGIAGDWQNYFTDRVKEAFKARYGGLLVATGYEKDLNW